MAHNVWYALPALTAILIQVWLFVNSDKRHLISKSQPILLLFISLLCISAIELGTYTEFLTPSLLTLKTYYVACFIAQIAIFIQAMKLSGFSQKVVNVCSNLGILICAVLSVLNLASNNLIAGFEYISYSYTRTPGDYYWLVQLYLLSMDIMVFALLGYGMKKNQCSLNAKRAKILLFAISPLLFLGVLIVPLMQIGVQINASIIFPTLITYFLVVLLSTEKHESLFNLLMKLPFSKERESLNLITSEVQRFLINTEVSRAQGDKKMDSSLKALVNSIENLIVERAVEITQGSQIEAASLLGVSSSSICRKKKRA